MNLAQAQDVFYFCVQTHEELWEINQGDDVSMEFADCTALSKNTESLDDDQLIEWAEKAAEYLMAP